MLRRLVAQLLLPLVLAIQGSTQTLNRGSGFIITPQGDVLTSQHVVEGCSSTFVRVEGKLESAQILAADRQNDLALLSISGPSSTWLSFQGNRLKLGQPVVVVGYPLQGIISSSLNLTTGTVSALAGVGNDARIVQFTAPIQPGNSGGPVLDQSGNIAGIVQSKLSPLWAVQAIGDLPQNVNFAVKGTVIRDFLDSKGGIEYRVASSEPELTTISIAEKVGNAVVAIECASGGAGTAGGAAVISSSPQPAEAVLFFAYRTSKHVTYSTPEVFQEIVDSLMLFLKSRNVALANDRIEKSLQSEQIASVYDVIRYNASRVGASHVLFLTVDRPVSAWVKLRLQCFDRDGHQLWEETSQKTNWMNSNFHTAVETMQKAITKRLAEKPLPRSTSAN